jgi:hypothetical protein
MSDKEREWVRELTEQGVWRSRIRREIPRSRYGVARAIRLSREGLLSSRKMADAPIGEAERPLPGR